MAPVSGLGDSGGHVPENPSRVQPSRSWRGTPAFRREGGELGH